MSLVELVCKRLSDGMFRGRIVVDDASDPNLHVDPGTCEDLRQIWIEARDKYGIAPSIGEGLQRLLLSRVLGGRVHASHRPLRKRRGAKQWGS